MNPDVFKKKTPHVYTQEEALEMKRSIRDFEDKIYETEKKSKKVRSQLDIALQIMSKEQLIEFINKTL
jgi:hypothetical protein